MTVWIRTFSPNFLNIKAGDITYSTLCPSTCHTKGAIISMQHPVICLMMKGPLPPFVPALYHYQFRRIGAVYGSVVWDESPFPRAWDTLLLCEGESTVSAIHARFIVISLTLYHRQAVKDFGAADALTLITPNMSLSCSSLHSRTGSAVLLHLVFGYASVGPCLYLVSAPFAFVSVA